MKHKGTRSRPWRLRTAVTRAYGTAHRRDGGNAQSRRTAEDRLAATLLGWRQGMPEHEAVRVLRELPAVLAAVQEFCDEVGGLTLYEIGALLGLSRERVRQIESVALAKMLVCAQRMKVERELADHAAPWSDARVPVVLPSFLRNWVHGQNQISRLRNRPPIEGWE